MLKFMTTLSVIVLGVVEYNSVAFGWTGDYLSFGIA